MNNKSLRIVVPTVLLSGLLLGTSAHAATIYVNPGQSIQQAIDAASTGDELVVRPGTYNGSINLRGKRITLRSVDVKQPELTTITSSMAQTSVVVCNSSETAGTIIDGFTISGGTGSTFGYWTVGGGFRIENASPTVRNCVIRGNSAWGGGGMFCSAAFPLISNCVFEGNFANGTGDYGGGAGMLSIACSPKFANCTFRNNNATGSAQGGAVRIAAGFNVYTNCVFANNEANVGGAIVNQSARPLFINCTIVGNHGRSYAGAMYGINASAVTTLSSSILWDNTTTYATVIYSVAGASFNIDHSIVQGGWAGVGNVDADPRFKNAATGDYRLNADSPCFDSGNQSALPTDYADIDGDGDVFELLPLDLDMASRTIGMQVDMGAFESPASDPGPTCPTDLSGDRFTDVSDLYSLLQAWGNCPASCQGDFNGDFKIDVHDLVTLLAAWGACP